MDGPTLVQRCVRLSPPPPHDIKKEDPTRFCTQEGSANNEIASVPFIGVYCTLKIQTQILLLYKIITLFFLEWNVPSNNDEMNN